MKKTKYIYLLLILILASCQTQETKKETLEEAPQKENNEFKFWAWTHANNERTDESYIEEYKKYKDNGIDAIFINTNADPKLLSRLAPIAKKEGLEVHAWMFTMNRPGDTVALKHPDWYMVSRSGKSCFDARPYVDYYQWLSPSHPDARQHIWSLVEGLAEVEDVASVHLDYIRYPDVYLPVALLPKYGITQDEELPDYDFDYSDASVNAFKEKFGRDPREMENPAIDIEWKQFRLNEIRNVVNHAYKIAHEHGKILTAAVFPYPEMADHMVRQRWDKWKIDVVTPMIYNSFYNEGVDWVGFATAQGVSDLQGTGTELHTGIYVPELSPEELEKAIQTSKDNGAKGVSFFDGNALNPEKLTIVKKMKAALN
ncbi:Putative glycosyl hydrolase domain-containing protein [Pustulibacterium marinum]|uniref:Putative glycosyl hydrolase domain-containing protein n=1 Tax=Pustulibacterium marinum TaxID=1224947 RepID=A0A1I7G4B2_9FLAO|nr:family 10 glycosylhydrolase [Pustulibacterium marinum]SFU43282.1 Putative glycosyl hydrolase domain-containing protein [Pustulibacterium marinum]